MKHCVIFVVFVLGLSYCYQAQPFPVRFQILDSTAGPKRRVIIWHDWHVPQDRQTLDQEITAMIDIYQKLAQSGTAAFLIELPPLDHEPLVEKLNRYYVPRHIDHAEKLLYYIGKPARNLVGTVFLDERELAIFSARIVEGYQKRYFSDPAKAPEPLGISVGEIFTKWKKILDNLADAIARILDNQGIPHGLRSKIERFYEKLAIAHLLRSTYALTRQPELDLDWQLFIHRFFQRAFGSLSSYQHTLEQFEEAVARELDMLNSVFDFFLSEDFQAFAIDLLFADHILTSQAKNVCILTGSKHAEDVAEILCHTGFAISYDSFTTLINGVRAKTHYELLMELYKLGVTEPELGIKHVPCETYEYTLLSIPMLDKLMNKITVAKKDVVPEKKINREIITFAQPAQPAKNQKKQKLEKKHKKRELKRFSKRFHRF